MYVPSARWASVVANSHRAYERVELLDQNGNVRLQLPINASDPGQAVEDSTNTIRGYCNFSVVDADGTLAPKTNTDVLAPYGRKLVRIVRGVIDPLTQQSAGEVPVGQYLLKSIERSLEDPGVLEVQCYDRFINAQKPTASAVQLTNATPVPTAIKQVLWNVDPSMPFFAMESLSTWITEIVPLETDSVSKAIDMAATIGAEVFMNREDVAVIQPIPTGIDTRSEWTFSASRGVVVVGGTNRMEADSVYNGVIVVAQMEGQATEVVGEAWDLDPLSPTFRYGDYGQNPKIVRTDKFGTVAQAEIMARGELTRQLGAQHEVTLEHSPNPALQVGDVVELDLPGQGLEGKHVIRRIEWQVGDPAGPQRTTVVRAQRAIDIG